MTWLKRPFLSIPLITGALRAAKKEMPYPQITNRKGKLVFDQSKPDGAKYKTVDGSKAAEIFGWSPEISLIKGIKETVDWYLESRKGGLNVSRSN